MQNSQLVIMNLSMKNVTHCIALTEAWLLNLKQAGYYMHGEGKTERASIVLSFQIPTHWSKHQLALEGGGSSLCDMCGL
jgi:hypothetical protein